MQLQERIRLVDIAARGYVKGAPLARLSEGPFGDATALELRADDLLVIAWRQESVRLMEDSATLGDIDSIAALATMHDSTGSGTDILKPEQKSPEVSLMYWTALAEILHKRPTRPMSLERRDDLIAKASEGLTAEQAAAAVAKGRALALSCCPGK